MIASLPNDAMDEKAAALNVPLQRSLSAPFNRAGAPSIADLGFDAQPEAGSERDNKEFASKDLIGFPGERVSHISFGFEGERWRIRNVAWVVSQCPTGEKLLDILYRAGYRIGFDAMSNTGERYNNYVNSADKVIVLDSRAAPHSLVTALSFQMGIASAAIEGIYFDASLTPPSALLAHRLAMAYAHTLHLQVAYELRFSRTLPAKADRELYWRTAAKEQPRLASAYAQSAINEMAISQGIAGAHVVREFFEHMALRQRYDTEVINFYRSLPAATLRDPRAMIGLFDLAAQSFKLKFPFITHAVNHDPKLNLLDINNVGTSATIVAAIAELHSIRKIAGVKDRDSWQTKEV